MSSKRLCLYLSEPAWHLLIGGMDSNASIVSPVQTVELYNWQTGEQCKINDIPTYLSWQVNGVVLEGTPAYCGAAEDKGCYKYDKIGKKWIQVSSGKLYRDHSQTK